MMSNYIAPFFVSVRTNFTIYIIFAAVAFIFILIIAVLLLILFKKSKKNKNDAQVRDIPVAEAPVNTTSNTVSIKKDEAKLNDEANPNDKVFCSNCGQENNAGDKFCSSCGKEIL